MAVGHINIIGSGSGVWSTMHIIWEQDLYVGKICTTAVRYIFSIQIKHNIMYIGFLPMSNLYSEVTMYVAKG